MGQRRWSSEGGAAPSPPPKVYSGGASPASSAPVSARPGFPCASSPAEGGPWPPCAAWVAAAAAAAAAASAVVPLAGLRTGQGSNLDEPAAAAELEAALEAAAGAPG